MSTTGQRARNVMDECRPCTIKLRDGSRLDCECIIKVSTGVVLSHSGDIEVRCGGQAQTVFIDDIQEIQTNGELEK